MKGKRLLVALSGPVIRGHWHNVHFLVDTDAGSVDRLVALHDPEFEGTYWLCGNWEVLSTAEVIERLEKGLEVRAMTGPHKTKWDAEDCADAAWEAPGTS